ncbi:MAG: hypothetical protein ACRDOO_18625 [Actinomadura sp.]
MLKRLLVTVPLAASALLVTGTAQASGPSVRAAVQHVTPTSTPAGQPRPSCLWQDGCYKCYDYRNARWTIQHCDGGDGDSEG